MSLRPYVLFDLAGGCYALPSDSVLHLEMFERVTVVPNANPAVAGVVYSRGEVIVAVNLRARFGLPPAQTGLKTRIVFTKVHDRVVGLIVDAAREFRSFDPGDIRPLEESMTGVDRKCVAGMIHAGGRLILILDLDEILNVADLKVPEAPTAQKTPH